MCLYVGEEHKPLTSSLLLLCISQTFDFFMAQLTLMGKDKMDTATIQLSS